LGERKSLFFLGHFKVEYGAADRDVNKKSRLNEYSFDQSINEFGTLRRLWEWAIFDLFFFCFYCSKPMFAVHANRSMALKQLCNFFRWRTA